MKTFADYRAAALRTANVHTLTQGSIAENACLGLIGELGEIADLLKKHRYQGHDLDRDKLHEELGDLLWYVALAAHAMGHEGEWPDWRSTSEGTSLVIFLSGSVGEMVDLVYHRMIIPHESRTKFPGVLDEVLGEIKSIAQDFCGSTLEAVAAANIAKLQRRYPDGFRAERSTHREDQ